MESPVCWWQGRAVEEQRAMIRDHGSNATQVTVVVLLFPVNGA
jgi:hypothetical protein